MSNLKDGVKEKRYTQQFRDTDETLYDESSEYIKPKSITLLWFLDNLPEVFSPSNTVLDICSGSGRFGYSMKKEKDLKFKYICTDIKNILINMEDTIFIQHDIRDTLPINNNEVNQVLLFSWYYGDLWDIDYSKLFQDVNRVMKFGGLFYFDFPSVDNEWPFNGGGGGTMEERRDIESYVRRAGFSVLKKTTLVRSANCYNTFICKKMMELNEPNKYNTTNK